MDRYNDREQYFLELSKTSRAYFVNYVSRFKPVRPGSRVLEIGCGEGGNLLPFAEAGCQVVGLDLAEQKIANANTFFRERNIEGLFLAGSFLLPDLYKDIGRFDIVIVHDVIEHIDPENKATFIGKIKDYMAPGAIVFFGFPAWQMPFGGHQQICRSKVCRKLPFAHLLPPKLYESYLRHFGESDATVSELLQIKRAGTSVEKFMRLSKETGYEILDRKLWFINPHYKVKFGLTPARLAWPFSAIPYLRNFLSTSCFFILRSLY